MITRSTRVYAFSKSIPFPVQIALVAILYFLAGKLGALVSVANGTVSPVWPATGLANTAVLLLGYRLALGVYLGGAAFVLVQTQNPEAAILVGFANLVECTLTAYLIRRFISKGFPLSTSSHVFRYTLLGALIPCCLGGAMGASSMCLSGVSPWANWTILFSIWSLGDFMGAMIVAPFMLTWFYHPLRRADPQTLIEAGAMTLLLLAGNFLIFFSKPLSLPMADYHFPLVFLSVPMLIWAAFRFEQHGAVSAILLTSVLAIVETTQVTGSGPGPMGLPHRSILLVQYYMAVTTITILVLAAAASETHRIRERLNKQTHELVRSNRDLQQFAYVASHDLQEPLRMMSTYCQLLERTYPDTLNSEGKLMLGHVMGGAQRMKNLIQDLLAYSKIGQAQRGLMSTDCNKVLDQAMKNIALLIQEQGLVLTQDPLPTVVADPIQLEQLFQNLLTNSIKYCDQRPARVHFRAEQHDTGWCFKVTDNGIGIDPEHHEKIFLIFQRLHNRERYAGTGIGLAICKKIVESHGGRIWVESTLGHGSIFSFVLPGKGVPSSWVRST